MKILITGATGFLGSHLLQVLLKEKLEIIVLKKSFSNTWRIQSLLNKVNCYNIDQIPLEKIIKEHHIDIIIHTATNYGRGQVNYKNIIDDNILYPIRILESSLNYYPNIRFINTDTFFSKPQFFSDYLPHYTLSKTQLLSWLKLFSEQVSIVNMRLEHVYGPADSHNKFIPRLISNLQNNKQSIDLTNGEQKRDFIFVEDVVHAFLLVIKNDSLKNIGYKEYEVGTGSAISIKKFITKMKHCTSSTTILNFGKLPQRKSEIMHSQANNLSLLEIGWKPQYSMEQGIQKTLAISQSI